MLDYWVAQQGGGCAWGGGAVGSHWWENMPLERMTRPLVTSSFLVHGADASSFALLQLPWPLSHTGPNCEASQAQSGTFKLWGKNKPLLFTNRLCQVEPTSPWDTIVCSHKSSHKKFKETLLIMAPRRKQAKYVHNREADKQAWAGHTTRCYA